MDNRPYSPGDSTATRPSATVATAPHPADETYSTAKSSGFFRIRSKHERKELIYLSIVLLLLAALIAAIVIPRLQSAVNANQSFYARAAGSFVGWVGTGPYGARIAIQILPCQHDPCTNVTLDVAIQDEPLDTPRHYTLGGGYLRTDELYVSAFTSGGIIYSADIITDHPVQNGITTGLAKLTLKRGTDAEVFTLTSATLNQISDYFGA